MPCWFTHLKVYGGSDHLHGGGIVSQHMLVAHAKLPPLVQVLQAVEAQLAYVLWQIVVLGYLLRTTNTYIYVNAHILIYSATHIRLQQTAQLVEQLALLRLRLKDMQLGGSMVYATQAAQLSEVAKV